MSQDHSADKGDVAPDEQELPEEGATVVSDFKALVRMSGIMSGVASVDDGEALTTSPEIERWRTVRQRFEQIPEHTAWPAPTRIPEGSLEYACVDGAGRRALLVLEGVVYLLDLSAITLTVLPVKVSHPRWIRAVFSSDGAQVALLEPEGHRLVLIELDTPDGQPRVRSVPFAGFDELGEGSAITGTLSPDRSTLALGSDERSARALLVRWSSGDVVDRLPGDCSRGILFDPSGRYLVACGRDHARILDQKGGERCIPANRVTLCPCRPEAVVLKEPPGGGRPILIIMDLETLQPRGQLGLPAVPGFHVERMRYSPDGSRVAVVMSLGEAYEVHVYDAMSGAETHDFSDPEGGPGLGMIYEMGFTHEGHRLLVFGASRTSTEQPMSRQSLLFYDVKASRFLGSLLPVVREHHFTAPHGEPVRLPVGRSSDGFFGRLDTDGPTSSDGYKPPFEWPWMVRCTLAGVFDPSSLDAVNRARLEDLRERQSFWREHGAGPHARELVDLTCGYTPLLPEIAHRLGPHPTPSRLQLTLASLGPMAAEFEAMVARMLDEEHRRLEAIAEANRLESERREREEAERRAREEVERREREAIERKKREKDAKRIAEVKKRVRFRAALADVGLTEDSQDLLYLIPLIEVALADGTIQKEEGEALKSISFSQVFGGERREMAVKLHQQTHSMEWYERMKDRLSPEVFGHARRLLVVLATHEAYPVFHPGDLDALLPIAQNIAEAAGGFFGMGKVSKEEKEILNALAADIADPERCASTMDFLNA